MDAYDLILNFINECGCINPSEALPRCRYCGCRGARASEKGVVLGVCAVCELLNTPNAELFGMLTHVRAHSAISFFNSLVVFSKDEGLTLVVSENYAKGLIGIKYVRYVVYCPYRYIINLLSLPKESVIIKPSIRYEDFAPNLMLSDSKSLYVTTPNGGYCIHVESWNKAVALVKSNDKGTMQIAIRLLSNIATGVSANNDADVREFVAKNHVLMIRLNDLLSMDIHSRLFILKLLKLVCDDLP